MATRDDSDPMTTPRVDDEQVTRCAWAMGEWLTPYHDDEWGVPVHDDRRHYEFLVLEAAQAGLSWLTVLKRREGYRKAFAGFDPEAVARFSANRIEVILADPGVIRNRQKIESAVGNARALLEVRDEFASFDAYLWGFVDGTPVHNAWRSIDKIPATTPLSVAVSKDLNLQLNLRCHLAEVSSRRISPALAATWRIWPMRRRIRRSLSIHSR